MRIRLINFDFLKGAKTAKEEKPADTMTTERAIASERQRVIQTIEARLNERRIFSEKLADGLVRWFGSINFIILNFVAFLVWIALNLDLIPGIKPFDPFPFILLTMVVSLEAIFLSVFVLLSQNRESRISDLREEIDLQINMIAEQEITKIIRLLAYLMKHLNVPYERDPELKRMMKPLDTEEIRRQLEKELSLPAEK